MTISVCMGLYNGEKYIGEQLMSIFRQTLSADEVVLCDDGSGDRTVEIVKSFIREHHLENSWKLYRNEENKGYPGNFYYAMSLCGGDVVFLADQDDIWDMHKLERMAQVFQVRPEAKAVCCKFGLVDASGAAIHTLMAPARSRGTGKLRSITIEDVFYKCEWPGMVMAYSGAWYRKRREEWAGRQNRPDEPQGLPHDFLISAWAAEENGFWQLDEELAWHRRHDANTGGEEHRIARLLNRERKLEEIENYLKILNRFDEKKVLREKRSRQILTQKRNAMKGRHEALKKGKLGNVLWNAWRNHRQLRIAAVVCDVLIVVRG